MDKLNLSLGETRKAIGELVLRPTTRFADLERFVQQTVQAWGTALLEEAVIVWGQTHSEQAPASIPGPEGTLLWRQRMESREIQTLYGPVVFERPYYWSPKGGGRCPLDDTLGLTDRNLSPGLTKVVSLLGAELPFSRAEQVIQALGFHTVCAKTLGSVAEETGAHLQATQRPLAEAAWSLMDGPSKGQVDRKQAGKTPQARWEDYPSEPVERLYIQADGGRIQTRDGWKEPKVGVLFTEADRAPTEERPRLSQKRYVAAFSTLETFLKLLWWGALEAGYQGAKEVIFLGDGARWLWKRCEELFPNAVQILDFYHACEHLWALGKALWGEEHPALARWVEARKERMKAGGIGSIVAEVRKIQVIDPERRKTVGAELAYFEENQERMAYHRYAAKGYAIGSGAVESGVKQVVNQRFKGSGMRWNQPQAEALLTLRAEILSGRFQKAA